MLLRLPEPYDFALSTERFRAFGEDKANLWRDGALHRVLNGREVRIAAAPGGVEVEPYEPGVAAFLGAGFDLDGFSACAAGDEVLAPIVERLAGFRPTIVPDPFEMLVTSVTAQQVSLHAAFAIRSRLIERFGVRHERAWAFPAEDALAAATEGELVVLGFSRRKAEYVVGLARARLDYGELARLPDGEVKARLTAVRGLGEWTADWYLARHLARPEAWPGGDLGLRRAVEFFYPAGVDPARFAPFQNLTCQYLLLALRTP